ncbi:Winged helix-turn-helix [uncultured archaeon]|nr:Winged helix-turn-helix [uncultured archaeon]
MAKRGRLEIIRDLLLILRENHFGIKFTPLLRKTNLSSARFSEYFEEIKSKDFIEEKIMEDQKRYFITDKGQRFLEKYQTISDFISEFEL